MEQSIEVAYKAPFSQHEEFIPKNESKTLYRLKLRFRKTNGHSEIRYSPCVADTTQLIDILCLEVKNGLSHGFYSIEIMKGNARSVLRMREFLDQSEDARVPQLLEVFRQPVDPTGRVINAKEPPKTLVNFWEE